MSSLKPKDRVSLCRYTYADHRKCLTPRSPTHAHFCYFHARRESQCVATDKLAADLTYFFSGQYISANDLCYAMGRLIPAVVRGDIKPRTASTLAYLAQTFIQAIQLAQKEYIYAFGTPEWGAEIRNNISGNVNHLNESNDAPDTESDTDTSALTAQPSANTSSDKTAPHDPNCSGRSLDPCSCSSGSPESEEQEENNEPLEPTKASAPSFSTLPKTCHSEPESDHAQPQICHPERSEGSAVSSGRQATRQRHSALVLPSKPSAIPTPLEATLIKN